MKNEQAKVSRIGTELVNYFLFRRVTHLSLYLFLEETETIIEIRGNIGERSVNLENIIEKLNAPRLIEYDDYYDELLGKDIERALHLVGYLTDKAEVSIRNGQLIIKLWRHLLKK
ncbi:MAG TPA: hypothetical protein GXZ74_09285 [Tissierellia bacterium]|nr:hypothetical protein [Tissierellia bacterium]